MKFWTAGTCIKITISITRKSRLAIIHRMVLRAIRPNRSKGIVFSKVKRVFVFNYNQITKAKVFTNLSKF